MFMSEGRRERGGRESNGDREIEKLKESDRERERERQKWQGGKERRNPGEEERICVFVLPVALAPCSPSQLAFSDWEHGSALSHMWMLSLWLSNQMESGLPSAKACLRGERWGSGSGVRKGNRNGFRGFEILSLICWIDHQPHWPLSWKVREEIGNYPVTFWLPSPPPFFLFLILKGMWILCPAYGAWEQLLPCGVKKSHPPGWGPAGTLGRLDASPVPAKETAANSFSYHSGSLSHTCGVPVLAKGIKPTLAAYGIHISGFTPREKDQRGWSQCGTPLSPSPCLLLPVDWQCKGRSGNSQKSYVLALLLWAGRGCQGKHIPLYFAERQTTSVIVYVVRQTLAPSMESTALS